MSQFGPAEEILQPALEPGPGSSPDKADLTDRQKVGVLLQGTALLGHLDHGGWRLARGWEGARVSDDGRLSTHEVMPGRLREMPQDLLSRLALSLFSSQTSVAGRGVARSAVRSVLKLWRQSLSPLYLDNAVGQVLEAAPFLWEPEFGYARRTLVAEHYRQGRGHSWIVGPRRSRRRLLAAASDRPGLERLLTGEKGRGLWEGGEGIDPGIHLDAGRWWAAAAIWEKTPPSTNAERFEYSKALYALGKFERARSILKPLKKTGPRILHVWCRYHLGHLKAAKSDLRSLVSADLSPSETVDLAEVAVRILANSGDGAAIHDWVARGLAASHGDLRVRARLVAAVAAWDQGEVDRMEEALPEEALAVKTPQLAWRYYQARGLQAMARADGPAMVSNLTRALATSRRHLRRFEAGRLWSDLAVARVQAGDLVKAERACHHALRLMGACDGPSQTTLALSNLAEVRIRRGSFLNVEETLESSTRENRRSHNLRGAAQDAELWARYELVRGRPETALARCQEALARLKGEGVDWNQPELHVLAARALGWLDRPQEAANHLTQTTAKARAQIEPEERPALWALARKWDEARAAAQGLALEALWLRVLRGEEPHPAHWNRVDELDPYRGARLVYDCERLRPASTPWAWRWRAVDVFRRVGALTLAEGLETELQGPWKALEHYLRKPPGDPAALAELLSGAGYPDARLTWRSQHNERELVPAARQSGDREELSTSLGSGRFTLQAPTIDPVLRALFSVAVRDVVPSGLRRKEATANGMVGESEALMKALRRIARLAPQDVPILIQGESGTGKELVAREIHRQSPRRGGPFVPVNCAALPHSLVFSDLFGHVKGSFTGAERERQGVFETAQGGTVFLDEVGDLEPQTQGMLLRVLQEGEIRRVGESLSHSIDVRIVSATHRDLAQMVRDGQFREDLYYRIHVAGVQLPPLRDRGQDVILLAEHFLGSLAKAQPTGTQSPPPRLSPEARTSLVRFDWPGNVRQLENRLRGAMALCAEEGGVIYPEHLDLPAPPENFVTGYHEQVRAFRKNLIQGTLNLCGGNRTQAARRLGLTRQALAYLMKTLGID